ncbi:unnamed protein product [Rotaria magnacalcarata]|uniref:Uncharacterized protein n=2 Tax=Rotaria magnacalcarata TaxID=392030 RepID=A0A819TF69_9BILA|nr:unnamed protein product [Rotaria magnacalcarata]CAF4064673.1 unnamed protein product [Rotaria magnacalcarata]
MFLATKFDNSVYNPKFRMVSILDNTDDSDDVQSMNLSLSEEHPNQFVSDLNHILVDDTNARDEHFFLN